MCMSSNIYNAACHMLSWLPVRYADNIGHIIQHSGH